jgi:hypothetical protein
MRSKDFLRLTEADVKAALERAEKNAQYAVPQEGSAYYRDNRCIVDLAHDNLKLRAFVRRLIGIEALGGVGHRDWMYALRDARLLLRDPQ